VRNVLDQTGVLEPRPSELGEPGGEADGVAADAG
jgi:hypothetical protein